VFLFIISDSESKIVEILFVEHNKLLYHIAYNMLHDKEYAEEALQESFLKIADNVHIIERIPPEKRVAYCVVICKNVTLNILRGQKRISYIDYLEDIADLSAESTEDEYFEQEHTKSLRKSIAALDEDDKFILQLRYVKSLSYKQIGELLNISEEAAKKRGQRLTAKLKAIHERMEGGN